MSEETMTNNGSFSVDADWRQKINQLFDEIKKSDQCLTEPDNALKFDEFFYYWASGQTDSAEKLYQEIYPEMCERHFTRYAATLCKAHTDMLEGRRIESSEYAR